MATFAEFIAESYFSEAMLVWDIKGPATVTARFSAGPVGVLVTFERREPNGL